MDSKPLIVKDWSVEAGFKMEDVLKVPIWIKLPGLKLRYWNPKTLSRLASTIGKPLKMDELTANKEQVDFARLMVEVEIKEHLPDKLCFEDEQGPEGLSDHCPLVIKWSYAACNTKKWFRFFNMWSKAENYLSLVQGVWNQEIEGSKQFQMIQKQKLLKPLLKDLNKTRFANIDQQALAAKIHMEDLQKALQIQPQNVELQEKEKEAIHQYVELSSQAFSYWQQKAKKNWVQQRDENTTFLHAVIRKKQKRKQIFSYTKEDGTIVEDWKDIEDHFLGFFQNLLGKEEQRVAVKQEDRMKDVLVQGKWIGISSGAYTTKSGYMWLRGEGMRMQEAGMIWNKYNIRKHSFILWLVMRGRLLTSDRLQKLNIISQPVLCVLCSAKEESLDHLFLQCQFSKELLQNLRRWIGCPVIPDKISVWKTRLRNIWQKCKCKQRVLFSLLAAAIYQIWKVRNEVQHGQKLMEIGVVEEQIRQMLKWRVSAVFPEEDRVNWVQQWLFGVAQNWNQEFRSVNHHFSWEEFSEGFVRRFGVHDMDSLVIGSFDWEEFRRKLRKELEDCVNKFFESLKKPSLDFEKASVEMNICTSDSDQDSSQEFSTDPKTQKQGNSFFQEIDILVSVEEFNDDSVIFDAVSIEKDDFRIEMFRDDYESMQESLVFCLESEMVNDECLGMLVGNASICLGANDSFIDSSLFLVTTKGDTAKFSRDVPFVASVSSWNQNAVKGISLRNLWEDQGKYHDEVPKVWAVLVSSFEGGTVIRRSLKLQLDDFNTDMIDFKVVHTFHNLEGKVVSKEGGIAIWKIWEVNLLLLLLVVAAEETLNFEEQADFKKMALAGLQLWKLVVRELEVELFTYKEVQDLVIFLEDEMMVLAAMVF
ncbi:OLC1v1008041C1 [Oldenlandia corymbosa var. corymbosa]|uniref:OLC1v1008041C1 n=1 Tax=Oldenlandia corymbosa var. corymbosa TaxID=529605 RepID=A0AAV1DM67_OLDCO|nr:OLC1v1008041C1 [Oldenlandia corymbosa var. corymbosa]